MAWTTNALSRKTATVVSSNLQLGLCVGLSVTSTSWPGNFPGGLSEESDDSPIATALREAKEELGIPPNMVAVWGREGGRKGGRDKSMAAVWGKLPRIPNQVSPAIPPLVSIWPEHTTKLESELS